MVPEQTEVTQYPELFDTGCFWEIGAKIKSMLMADFF